ncbi:universal stress protein [Nocardioides sp. SR21]|uniref:universal stress protein n=1 Tax=Nocardioides sp. SR21 TaxID=2919501 RepID=UPI001FAAF0DF|nr:universal stress protein [Nocardioides sp. SR21]
MAGRIVVGIDGSEQSAAALEWAVARALLGDDELELVNTYNLVVQMDFFGYQGMSGQQVDWIVDLSKRLLEAAEARVRELAPDLACTARSVSGHPAPTLVAASQGAVALVVGRRGLGGAASALLGSVSNRITVEAGCPVVVVGEGRVPTTGPIVVGVDGSEFGLHALRYAVAEASLRGTTVRAIAAYDVLHPALGADDELVARMRAGVDAETTDTISRALGDVDVAVEKIAVEGPAAEAILDHARDAQLVVVGTHGKGLVRRVLLGSVSRAVLNDAERPVAVVDMPAT